MREIGRFAVTGTLVAFTCLLPAWLDAEQVFTRGDVDDSGEIDLSDSVQILRALFAGEQHLIECHDAADADDNGQIQLPDAVYLLSFLFTGGEPPPAPFPVCGADPTRDRLTCNLLSRRCEAQLLDLVFNPVDNGEAIVYVIDRSVSMQADAAISFAKREVEDRILALSEDHEFSVIFFDGGVHQYPEDGVPVLATLDEVLAAIVWIEAMRGGVRACPAGALDAALVSLEQSAAARKRVIFMSDSGERCRAGEPWHEKRADTLRAVAARNTEGVIIHSVAFGIRLSPLTWEDRQALEFLRALATGSGGLLVCKLEWSP